MKQLKLNVTHCYVDNLPNVSVSPLPFSAIDLKIWFKGMRTRYGKLTCKKSGDGAKEHTDRDRGGLLASWMTTCPESPPGSPAM